MPLVMCAGEKQLGPKGWYHSNGLPHCDGNGLVQHITYRLSDSLPQSALARMNQELDKICDDTERSRQQRMLIEQLLDAGYGSCVLREPEIAQLVVESWRYFDGIRYTLIAYVVMPNHCHVLIRQGADCPLGRIVQSWKSFTARRMKPAWHRVGGAHAQVWQREFWDRFIRNEEHFYRTIRYIHANPVKAGLCKRPEDWMFSSAGL